MTYFHRFSRAIHGVLILLNFDFLRLVQGTEFTSYHVCQPPDQRKTKVRLKMGSLGGWITGPSQDKQSYLTLFYVKIGQMSTTCQIYY